VRDAIERGAIPGPRIYAAGQPISATAGHGDRRFIRPDIAALTLSEGVCDGADDCRRAVRSQYKVGAETIKLHATGGGADANGRRESAPEMIDEELRAIVEAAHNLNLRVAAHAHGTAGINAALAAGVDSIEHGSWIDDRSIDLLLAKGSYVVPTAYLQDWFLARKGIPESAHEARRRNVALIHPKLSSAMKKGVKIAMGTDAGIMPHGLNAKEIVKYVELGMTPQQAIQTATNHAAKLLRIDGEVGTLEAGKNADVVALADNPLERINAVEKVTFVMRGGVVHRND
jgi:imidazolonepropionase-like amidohydrolase